MAVPAEPVTAATGTLTLEDVAPRRTAALVPSLTYWRIRRAMSQRELAERAGLHLRHVQRLEAGGNAGLDAVRHLAEALEIDPPTLMAAAPDA
jgi:DNA-binding Xre family transcriptional regulator